MKYYKQYTDSAGSFVYLKEYPDGRRVQVNSEYSGLVSHIAAGGTVTEIEYTAPPLPVLDIYKQQKKDAIGTECVARLLALTGNADVIALLFDFAYFNSKAAKLNTKKAIKGLELTAEEMALLTQLEANEAACNGLREYSDALKAAVNAASTHAEVDAVQWEI